MFGAALKFNLSLPKPQQRINKLSSSSSSQTTFFRNYVQRKFSTEEEKINKNVYELRTYTIQPSSFLPFLELTNKHIHLRTAYSKLIGYWISEIGGVNEVFHIWEYESLEQRQQVRVALVRDKPWMTDYMGPMRTMLQKQENSLIVTDKPVLSDDSSTGSVYELVTIPAASNLGTYFNNWPRVLEVGNWHSLTDNSRVILYKHDGLASVDKTIERKRKLLAAAKENNEQIGSIHSKIGFPTAFSPLQ